MDFFLLLSNTSVSEPCSLSEEWMRGHKYSPALAAWLWALEREFISTKCLPKASLLSKHNRWIHKFQSYVPSHSWAGDQLQSSCKRLNDNHWWQPAPELSILELSSVAAFSFHVSNQVGWVRGFVTAEPASVNPQQPPIPSCPMDQRWLFTFLLPRTLAEGQKSSCSQGWREFPRWGFL